MVEEEVSIEVEAVKAVYGDDCLVLDSFPLHLNIHIKPRTADISSQQFVEAVIAIRTGPRYPEEPPCIQLVESKGLDEQRQRYLINSIQDKACELSSCLMLVLLCEEAVEKLTAMNHPDGNCPLCLYPLVSEDDESDTLFMKLMSCFHCFHSECIIRWWYWRQQEKESNAKNSSSTNLQSVREIENQNDMDRMMDGSMGNCPVCRKVFHAKDFEHVLGLVETHSSQLSSNETEVDDDTMLLHSDSENIRRQKFEAILKIQEDNNGLIEPKQSISVLPGMFLPQPVTSATEMLNKETTDQQQRDSATVPAETNSGGSSNRHISIGHRNHPSRRKQRVRNSGKQVQQWVRKESDTAK